MQKPLVAAVVLAAVIPLASAQSSVTLFGVVDAWVGKVDTKVGASTAEGWVSESNGFSASRWGLRGTEDLGQGLKLQFVLDTGFLTDTGAQSSVSGSTSGFNRGAWVGLAGGFGEVRIGRMLTAYDAWRGSNNHVYDSGFAATGQVWGAGATASGGLAAVTGSDYIARGNNTLYYKTPAMGPFIASVSLSLDERQTTATASPRIATGHAEYTAGPLRLGVAVQDERYTTGHNRFRMLAGRYDFGVARLVANVQRQDDERVATGQQSREWQVGVDVPLGTHGVAVGYARSVTRNDAGRTLVDADGVGALGYYALSKRTRVYAGVRKVTVDRADGSRTLEQTRYGAGVNHVF